MITCEYTRPAHEPDALTSQTLRPSPQTGLHKKSASDREARVSQNMACDRRVSIVLL